MNYRLIIRKHLVPFFGDMRLDEINTVDVQRFYNQHAHQSRSTVNKLALILHGIFDSAIEDGLCVIDPTRSKRLTYSKKKTFREALSIEDAQDIITNLPKLELKDRLLVALLLFTGIRRGEALGLQWEDIDFDRKLINIRRSVRFAGNKGYIGPTKSKAGVRLIPLEPQLEEILMVLPPDSKYILGIGEFPITEMTYKNAAGSVSAAPSICLGHSTCAQAHIYHDGGDPPGHQHSADHCRALGHQHHYEQVCPRTRG
jgi:integrase